MPIPFELNKFISIFKKRKFHQLVKKELSKVICQQCPKIIPRSGKAGASVNCFEIYLNGDGIKSLLVEGIENDELHCLKWNGNRYEDKTTVKFDDIDESDLVVKHIYGYAEIEYLGFKDFFIGRLFKVEYLKLKVTRFKENFIQFNFNRKKIVAKQRHEILSKLLSLHLEGKEINAIPYLLSELYSSKWIYHPDKKRLERQLRLHMILFRDNGEIHDTPVYTITGKGLQSIELYEEQERKHKAQVIMQWLTFLLTLFIAIFTAVQAEIIKLPTLWDLK